MSLPGPVYVGTGITTTATFTVPGAPGTPGVLTDPTVVTLSFRVAGGTPTVWTYGGAGSIVKVSTGVYSAELLANALGEWDVKWEGTSACAAVNVASFSAVEPPF